ncbi:MAG TPA: HAD family phosphatase [Candidatus Binataceae bacterium]|nr:HAD family phosphatase [Candidatus Binataceae bacterium]
MIFDLDGTLADSEPLHFEAFRTTLQEVGLDLDRTIYYRDLIGFNDYDCLAAVLHAAERQPAPALVNRLAARKAELYQAMIAERDVLYPGAADFVRRCAERFPLALATGTLRVEAETILQRAGLRDRFVELVAAEDVAHGKPAPDGFLTALGRLGFLLRPRPSLMPAECLVVEDTVAGITAAHRAGMRVLAVAQTAPAAELAAADWVRPSLAATDLDELLQAAARD